MHPYTYKIRFLLIHPNLDFTEVRARLSTVTGLNASRLMNVGDHRTTPNGTKLEAKHHDSRWGFDFETSDEWHDSKDQSAPDAINEMLQQLEPHKQMFNNLASSGCDIQLIVSVIADKNTADGFGQDLLRSMAEFRMNLWFDFYPPIFLEELVRYEIFNDLGDDAYGSWELWWGLKEKIRRDPDITKRIFINVMAELVKEGKLAALHHRSWDQKENVYTSAVFDRKRLEYEVDHSLRETGLDPDTFYWFELTEAGKAVQASL
jgi:hypothetical protein